MQRGGQAEAALHYGHWLPSKDDPQSWPPAGTPSPLPPAREAYRRYVCATRAALLAARPREWNLLSCPVFSGPEWGKCGARTPPSDNGQAVASRLDDGYSPLRVGLPRGARGGAMEEQSDKCVMFV